MSRGLDRRPQKDKEKDTHRPLNLERDRTPKEREHKKRVVDDRDQIVKKIYGEKIDPHKKPYSNFNLHKEDKGKGKVQWY